jgi:hypothetical protein
MIALLGKGGKEPAGLLDLPGFFLRSARQFPGKCTGLFNEFVLFGAEITHGFFSM